MKNLIIEQTVYTPEIILDYEKGVFSMVGKSYPENTFAFYEPVVSWIEDYFQISENEKVVLNMEIIYFNSSSSKLFFDLLDLFEEASKAGKKVEINWFYDKQNDSALEAGEDFKEDFEDLIFNLVEK